MRGLLRACLAALIVSLLIPCHAHAQIVGSGSGWGELAADAYAITEFVLLGLGFFGVFCSNTLLGAALYALAFSVSGLLLWSEQGMLCFWQALRAKPGPVAFYIWIGMVYVLFLFPFAKLVFIKKGPYDNFPLILAVLGIFSLLFLQFRETTGARQERNAVLLEAINDARFTTARLMLFLGARDDQCLVDLIEKNKNTNLPDSENELIWEKKQHMLREVVRRWSIADDQLVSLIAADGQVDCLKSLYGSSLSADQRIKALLYALKFRELEMIKFLLQSGIKLNEKVNGQVLPVAAEGVELPLPVRINGSFNYYADQVLALLYDHGIDLHEPAGKDGLPLGICYFLDNPDRVAGFLSKRGDSTLRSEALLRYLLSLSLKEAVVHDLIAGRIDPKFKDIDGRGYIENLICRDKNACNLGYPDRNTVAIVRELNRAGIRVSDPEINAVFDRIARRLDEKHSQWRDRNIEKKQLDEWRKTLAMLVTGAS